MTCGYLLSIGFILNYDWKVLLENISHLAMVEILNSEQEEKPEVFHVYV